MAELEAKDKHTSQGVKAIINFINSYNFLGYPEKSLSSHQQALKIA
ncbi:MAG: hypothetical protein GDA43_15885 [Hormoscilla sp. SP5CHS1]|nr:hypothetical protein [Hormoscilla sp. SP12CHS1]MBC6454491.1 hypothetical protein [Hormoscilla sp. SP5CHS1]